MHISKKRNSGPIGLALSVALLGGCASPGPPLPPSLKLPEVPTDLSASRAGDAVTLRWTTPARTTDKLLIAGPIVAEICRETLTAPPIPASAPASGAKPMTASPCAPVLQRLAVVPGESQAVDPLPAALAYGPPRLLAYRVQLRNGAGRTAGASGEALAASGAAPQQIAGLRAQASKAGVVLEWQPDNAVSGSNDESPSVVELDRTTLDGRAPVRPAAPSGDLAGLTAAAKEPVEVRLRVGASAPPDPGGTIDRGAQIGHTYHYTAQRVRTVVLGAQTFEVRSSPSASVIVAFRDVFPPDAPTGLVAAPALTGPADATRKPAIDLSWEPDMEPRLAGYRVYRLELDGTTTQVWRPLGSELVTVPAYRDLSVVAGQRYAYRVTAVDSAAKESPPSSEVTETAPSP
jgi:hypothetical protein